MFPVRLFLLITALFTAITTASAKDFTSEQLLTDPSDLETWQWILERADQTEHVELDRNGQVAWIGFEGENQYQCSIQLDPQGRVIRATFNEAVFSDQDLHKLAGFKHLLVLTAWHNFKSGTDISITNPYSGAGLEAFAGSKLESVNFGGSYFDDAGIIAGTRVPSLKELIIYHTRVTNAGMEALAGDTHIEYVRLAPQFSLTINDDALPHLAKMQALRHLEINEALLTWEGLQYLTQLKGQLEQLTFKQTEISAEDMAKLQEALPEVSIEHTQPEADQVAKLRRLQEEQSTRGQS